ncbi:MAG TPA: MFS transporter [Gaiellaceae bacterium]
MEPIPPEPFSAALRRRLAASVPSRRPVQAVLAMPHVKALAGASFVARLPRGMASLAVVLLVHEASGSYAVAGGAAGAMAIGDAAISPIQGRLIDRLGQRRVLLPSAVFYLLVLCVLATAAAAHWPPALMIGLAAVGGMAYPPISASMKTLWPVLVGGELLQTAYAIESLIQQSFFFLGPLLVAALVAVGSPAAAVIATGAFALAGTIGFVASPASRAWRGGGRKRSRTGALAHGGVRLIVAVTVTQSVVFGTLYVAVPAFAARHGNANAAGVLLAVMNVGALAGGLVGASRLTSQRAVNRYLRLSALLAVSIAPLLLARSLATMGLLLAVAGLFVAPTAAASYVLVELVSPHGYRTEAFTWMSTAVAVGGALGSTIAGALTDHASVEATLLFAVVSCGAGATAVFAAHDWLQREALR